MNGDTILRAAIDDPADDLPRLAYADWLEEQGDGIFDSNRASMIREQIGNPTCEATYHLPPLHPFHPKEFPAEAIIVWKRGFPFRCNMTMSQWLEYGPRIVARHPIENVTIIDVEPRLHRPYGSDDMFALDSPPNRPFLYLAPSPKSFIPEKIYLLLPNRHLFAHTTNYETRDEAMRDLAQACILWAKTQGPPHA